MHQQPPQTPVYQILVYDGDECVGWCQNGSPVELPNINNPKAYARGLGRPVRGVWLRAGSEDSEVAVGDAVADPALTEALGGDCSK